MDGTTIRATFVTDITCASERTRPKKKFILNHPIWKNSKWAEEADFPALHFEREKSATRDLHCLVSGRELSDAEGVW